MRALAAFFHWEDGEPVNAPPGPPQAPLPPIQTPMTKAEILYKIALSSLHKDMSPEDHAPDSLACMESVDGVWLAAFGEHLLPPGKRLSTELGYRALLVDPRVQLLVVPEVGCIVISPSGYSNIGTSHGHTGIWGNFDVMSNDSNTGLWTDNYSHAAWYQVFQKTLGFPVYFFKPV